MAFRLSDGRCEKIKQIIADTFIHLKIECVPISGFEIATKLGITVIPYSAYFDEVKILLLKQSADGFSILKDDKWYIFYNDSQGYGRINNTMMDEVGHIILDHSQESELAEAEAKFFAKYALAPPVLIHKLKQKDAHTISCTFGISIQAACYALDYYNKWLTCGNREYTDYEICFLQLFKEAI